MIEDLRQGTGVVIDAIHPAANVIVERDRHEREGCQMRNREPVPPFDHRDGDPALILAAACTGQHETRISARQDALEARFHADGRDRAEPQQAPAPQRQQRARIQQASRIKTHGK
jgi:hypothetical protein